MNGQQPDKKAIPGIIYLYSSVGVKITQYKISLTYIAERTLKQEFAPKRHENSDLTRGGSDGAGEGWTV